MNWISVKDKLPEMKSCLAKKGKWAYYGNGKMLADWSGGDIIEEITDKPKYVIKAGVTVEEIGRAMCSHFGTKFSEAGRENDEKALLK
ncbi:MAG: hypothetical protein GY853_00555, partial [PVC group bacterium]|nr:hypothetical protein [PVC group bacterium]